MRTGPSGARRPRRCRRASTAAARGGSGGAGDRGAAGADAATAPRRAARRRGTRTDCAPAGAACDVGPQPFVQPRDLAGELGAAACRSAPARSRSACRRSRGSTSRRRRATRASAPPTTTIVAVRFRFIGSRSRDRSTRDLHGCAIIRRAPCIDWFYGRFRSSARKSSPSSPPDSPPRDSPAKPLADIDGRPMIEHVYRRAAASPVVSRVIVATDDLRIATRVQRVRRQGAADARRPSRPAPIGSPRSPRRSTATSSSTCRATSRCIDPRAIDEAVAPFADPSVSDDDAVPPHRRRRPS